MGRKRNYLQSGEVKDVSVKFMVERHRNRRAFNAQVQAMIDSGQSVSVVAQELETSQGDIRSALRTHEFCNYRPSELFDLLGRREYSQDVRVHDLVEARRFLGVGITLLSKLLRTGRSRLLDIEGLAYRDVEYQVDYDLFVEWTVALSSLIPLLRDRIGLIEYQHGVALMNYDTKSIEPIKTGYDIHYYLVGRKINPATLGKGGECEPISA